MPRTLLRISTVYSCSKNKPVSFRIIVVCFNCYTSTHVITFSRVSWSCRGCSVCWGMKERTMRKLVVSVRLLGINVCTECLQGEGAAFPGWGMWGKEECDTTEHSPPTPFYIIARIYKTMCWSGWQLALATMAHNHRAYRSVILTVHTKAHQFMENLAYVDIDLCWRNGKANRCLYRHSNATVLANPLRTDFLL
jgi:hypothetical protein